MFGFISNTISRLYTSLTTTLSRSLSRLFARPNLDEAFYSELEQLLMSSDVGYALSKAIVADLKTSLAALPAASVTPERAHALLKEQLIARLSRSTSVPRAPRALMLIGVNGSGKTTFISKYAALLRGEKKRVLLIAADTFRAAAVEQLTHWAETVGVDIYAGTEKQDPAAVVFDGCKKFVTEGYDHLIIDTAGRLQTRINLLKELEKMSRSALKHIPQTDLALWLTIDTMLGQNGLAQAEEFTRNVPVSGLVLTKCDGTGKGGILFAITEKLQLSICYMTHGENVTDIMPFSAERFVETLLCEPTTPF